jgi:hypothetical protein
MLHAVQCLRSICPNTLKTMGNTQHSTCIMKFSLTRTQQQSCPLRSRSFSYYLLYLISRGTIKFLVTYKWIKQTWRKYTKARSSNSVTCQSYACLRARALSCGLETWHCSCLHSFTFFLKTLLYEVLYDNIYVFWERVEQSLHYWSNKLSKQK